MSSFDNLLSRLNLLTESNKSPMDRLIPGFQNKARELAKHRGASSGTREGRLAMLSILLDLDIIDSSTHKMFKNDSSVTRMVDYFESNGISTKIKSKRDEIQAYIKDQLENKVSFTTGNRADAALQRYELNKLNNELKVTKKAARLERKKETASAMSSLRQTVDMYDDLVGSIKGSFSNEYMLEIVASKDSDLDDISQIIKYLSKFVDESDIDIEGKSIDVVFSVDSKLGKIVTKMGVESVERTISSDLKTYGGAGVVIHEPDTGKRKDLISNLNLHYSVEDEESPSNDDDFAKLAEEYQDAKIDPSVKKVQQNIIKMLDLSELEDEEEGLYESAKLGQFLKTTAALATVAGLGLGTSALEEPVKKIAPKVVDSIKSSVSDFTRSNEDFLNMVSDEERKEIVAKRKELIDLGQQAGVNPSGNLRQVEKCRAELRELVNAAREKNNIPSNIKYVFNESIQNTTSIYLTEQIKSDSYKRRQVSQGLTFKEKYKPKTSYQLEELRRYGL